MDLFKKTQIDKGNFTNFSAISSWQLSNYQQEIKIRQEKERTKKMEQNQEKPIINYPTGME